MSPIGRIFIVLNLILAALFLAWASFSLATAENWKAKYGDLEAEKTETVSGLEADISELTVKRNDAQAASDTARNQRDSFEETAARVQTNLTALKREKESLNGNLTSMGASMTGIQETVAQVSEAKDRAVEQMQEMERERNAAQDAQREAEVAQRDAQDALRVAEAQISDLQIVNTDLDQRVSRLDTQMAMISAQYVIPGNMLQQPDIDAAVLDVRMDLAPGLVMLNVGRDQEVKRGFIFDVYNGRQYKGQVRVENVDETMCSALIVGTSDGSSIQRGDRASTHI